MSLSTHTAAQRGFFGPVQKAAMPGHCCVAAGAGESSYPVATHIVLANATENPLAKGPAFNSADTTRCRSRWILTGQVLTRGQWCQTFRYRRDYIEITDQEIKSLEKPSTQLIQLVKKTSRTSALLFPYSLLPPSQDLLYHPPKQLPLSSPFSALAMGNQVMRPGITHVVSIPSMPPLWTLKVVQSPAFPILS